MYKTISLIISIMICMPTWGQHVNISTKKTTLILNAKVGERLNFVYYGQHLDNMEIEQLFSSGSQFWNAYPAYGMDVQRESAISVKHADGNMTLDLKLESIEEESEGIYTIERIKLKDSFYPFYVNICYRT